MKHGDWLIRALANNQIPEKVRVMWDPITWGLLHLDMIPKIMGQMQCTESERDKMKEFLYDEQRYELLVAMIYAENYDGFQKIGEVKKSEFAWLCSS